MITYDIPQPLFTVDSLRSQVTVLQDLVASLRRDLSQLEDSTLPTTSINLRTMLDAHLMKLGFSQRGRQTRSEFTHAHLPDIATALGVHPDQVEYLFRYAFPLLLYLAFPNLKFL